MARLLSYNATLVERQDITDKLAVFRVRPDEAIPEGAWFVPGQYMVLGLNNEEKPELGGVQRPMSIASPPEQRGVIDFYIRFVDRPESNNPLTHLLWKIRAGSRMFCRLRPTGKFTVRDTVGDDDTRLRVLVAAGTGLAPFTSMVDSVRASSPDKSLSNYAIIHGASYSADLGYREHLEGLARDHGLHYLPTVSRTHQDTGWKGAAGRAEDFFKSERLGDLEQRLGLPEGGFTPDRVQVLICGLQGTIGMCVQRLCHRGFIPDNRRIRRALGVEDGIVADLFYEAYDTTPPIDLKDEALVAKLKGELHTALAGRSRSAT
ncbi:MAG: hypothetical protein ACPG4T_02620 [Nannocystaceae bacterium]